MNALYLHNCNLIFDFRLVLLFLMYQGGWGCRSPKNIFSEREGIAAQSQSVFLASVFVGITFPTQKKIQQRARSMLTDF